MRDLSKAFYGALLVLGLACIAPEAVLAGGYHWDASCNCRRPDTQYTTRRYVREAPRLVTHHRYVDHTRVVRNTRLVQENRVIEHVRPVINREVVVHRTNTVVRNVTLHRVNTVDRDRVVVRNEVVNRYVGGSVRYVNEYRNVPMCNCGHSVSRYGGEEQVSYRN